MDCETLALSQRMRRDAELRYDSGIPIEIRAAISAQERIESDLRAMRGLDRNERLRFISAREFALAKNCFRNLVRMLRSGTLARPSRAWQTLREQARSEATLHLECWRDLRRREMRPLG